MHRRACPPRSLEPFYASLYTELSTTFEPAPGHVFELLDWSYDVSMRLRYLRYLRY